MSDLSDLIDGNLKVEGLLEKPTEILRALKHLVDVVVEAVVMILKGMISWS